MVEKSSLRVNAPISRFSCTLIEVKTFFSCGTKESPLGTSLSGSELVIASPAKVMDPESTLSRPNTALSVVDLPAPLGPTITPMSDCSMEMLTPFRMGAPP